ncbi:MAG: WavE lipopolysaccharide synthesis family protein [Terrimicrobiaceae bacterium]
MSSTPSYPPADPNGKNIGFVIPGSLTGHHVDKSGRLWHTKDCIQSIRSHFKNALIVISTFNGEDTSGLDADHVIFNEDPGLVHNSTNVTRNLLRQLVCAQRGLQYAADKVDYSVKFRGDFLLTGTGFLEAHRRYDQQPSKHLVFSSPVVGLNYYTNHPLRGDYLFAWSDLIHFGRSADVLTIWGADPPPVAEILTVPGETPSYRTSMEFLTEQYFWVSALERFCDLTAMKHYESSGKDLRLLHDRLLASNFVPMELEDFGVHWISRAHRMKIAWSRVYSHREWIRHRKRQLSGRWTIPDVETVSKYFAIAPNILARKLRKTISGAAVSAK